MSLAHAIVEVAQIGIEAGENVVAGDPDGRCVSLDIYSLGLVAATRHKVHPVRVLTAAIDVLWGLRDYIRGPKWYVGNYFGASYIGDVLNVDFPETRA